MQSDDKGRQGVEELREIFAKAERLGFADRLKFDWSLVRGLDYYTGPDLRGPRRRSRGRSATFAGGGRYDDLVGLYGGQAQGAVGLSFGVERLIGLIEERGGAKDALTPPVLVAPLDDAQFEAAERLALALRRAGVATRLLPALKRDKVFKYSTAAGLPQLVLVGADEAASGLFALRTQGGQEQRLDQAGLIAALSRSVIASVAWASAPVVGSGSGQPSSSSLSSADPDSGR